MSFRDLYESGEHRTQLAHFASIVNLAATDGDINDEENKLIERFARKLDISEGEIKEVMKSPNNYPINPPTLASVRLERLYDLFRIIYVDHYIDGPELKLLNRYATGLGFSQDQADSIIAKSMKLFGGKIDFEDYEYFVSK